MSTQGSDSPVRGVRWAGRAVVVDVAGEIDMNSSVAFQQTLQELMDRRPQRIVVNLAAVKYMDSSGLASLVKLLSRARKADAGLTLVGLADRVRSVFEISRLDTVFEIKADEQEALLS